MRRSPALCGVQVPLATRVVQEPPSRKVSLGSNDLDGAIAFFIPSASHAARISPAFMAEILSRTVWHSCKRRWSMIWVHPILDAYLRQLLSAAWPRSASQHCGTSGNGRLFYTSRRLFCFFNLALCRRLGCPPPVTIVQKTQKPLLAPCSARAFRTPIGRCSKRVTPEVVLCGNARCWMA
mgnify:CR=1 FL=1